MAKFDNCFLTPIQGFTQPKIEKAIRETSRFCTWARGNSVLKPAEDFFSGLAHHRFGSNYFLKVPWTQFHSFRKICRSEGSPNLWANFKIFMKIGNWKLEKLTVRWPSQGHILHSTLHKFSAVWNSIPQNSGCYTRLQKRKIRCTKKGKRKKEKGTKISRIFSKN